MEQNRKFVNVVTDETTSWQPDYNAEDLSILVDQFGWVPFERKNEEGRTEKRVYNPGIGFIKYIKWFE